MMLMTNVADDDRENGDDDITGQCDFVQRNHVHPVGTVHCTVIFAIMPPPVISFLQICPHSFPSLGNPG